MIINAKAIPDNTLHVKTPPPDDAILIRIGARLDKPRKLFFLSRRQPRLRFTRPAVDQTKRAVEAAGMDPEKVIPHTLRHTAITRFAGSAPDLKTLQAFSGHKSIQALLRYLHEQDKRVDEAMDRMEQARTSGESAGITKLQRA